MLQTRWRPLPQHVSAIGPRNIACHGPFRERWRRTDPPQRLGAAGIIVCAPGPRGNAIRDRRQRRSPWQVAGSAGRLLAAFSLTRTRRALGGVPSEPTRGSASARPLGHAPQHACKQRPRGNCALRHGSGPYGDPAGPARIGKGQGRGRGAGKTLCPQRPRTRKTRSGRFPESRPQEGRGGHRHPTEGHDPPQHRTHYVWAKRAPSSTRERHAARIKRCSAKSPGAEVPERDRVAQTAHGRDTVLPFGPRRSLQQVGGSRRKDERGPLPGITDFASQAEHAGGRRARCPPRRRTRPCPYASRSPPPGRTR